MTLNTTEPETPEAKKERLELELQFCNNALKQEPENQELLFNKSFLLNQLGRFEEAVPILEKIVNTSPSIQKYMQLGLAYTQIGEYEKALDVYDKVLCQNNSDEAHNCKGFVLSLMDKHWEAIKEYKNALELNQDYTDARLNLGFSFDKLGKHYAAIKEYDHIISLNPQDCCAHLNKGCSLAAMGWDKDALIEFDKSLSIRPDDALAHFEKGRSYYVCGEIEKAYNEFDQAVKLDNYYTEAHYYRAEIAELINRELEAISDYSLLISQNPDDLSLYEKRKALYLKLGMYDEALDDSLFILIQNSVEDIALHYIKGTLLQKSHHYDEAIAEYRYCTKYSRSKNRHYLYIKIAKYQSYMCRFSDVIDTLNEMENKKVKLNSTEDVYQVSKLRAYAYYNMMRYKEAFVSFEQCVRCINNSPEIFENSTYSDEIAEIRCDRDFCLKQIHAQNDCISR